MNTRSTPAHAIDSNLDYRLYSQAVIEDLKNVDVAAATAVALVSGLPSSVL